MLPDPAFPSKAPFDSFGILATEFLDGDRRRRRPVEKPVGTGPYKLEEWEGREMTFEANRYWGEKAKTRR